MEALLKRNGAYFYGWHALDFSEAKWGTVHASQQQPFVDEAVNDQNKIHLGPPILNQYSHSKIPISNHVDFHQNPSSVSGACHTGNSMEWTMQHPITYCNSGRVKVESSGSNRQARTREERGLFSSILRMAGRFNIICTMRSILHLLVESGCKGGWMLSRYDQSEYLSHVHYLCQLRRLGCYHVVF